MDAQKYSKRLGVITSEQFQTALDRFDLGRFISAKSIPHGLSKRNIFLTTTKGEFVFRGAPHTPYQFLAERYYTRNLHERTRVPVPWPYLVDTNEDIFGWNYVIMPRLPGLQLADRMVRERLTREEKRGIARAMGDNLALMQECTWNRCGSYDERHDTIQPFASGYGDWIIKRIRSFLARSQAYNSHTTAGDSRWVETRIQHAIDVLHEPFQPCFVMQDYKESNAVAEGSAGQWWISGVFDFTQAHVGDGEVDVARTFAQYLDIDPLLASEFLQAYLEKKPPRPGFLQRFPVYMLHERLQTWEFCQHVGHLQWDESLTLQEWANPYVSSLSVLSV